MLHCKFKFFLYKLNLIFVVVLDGMVESMVDLQPHGVEYVCAGVNLSRSLYCNVTGTRIEWNVKGGSNLVALFKYYLPLKDQQVRMQLQFWFLNQVSLSSQLVT